MAYFQDFKQGLQAFNRAERSNILFYILGIMIYKFGLEAFNGSIAALATNRYDYDAIVSGTSAKTFERLGLLQGLNQAFQCVGAIIIAPMIKRRPTKNVLSGAILFFGVLTAILLIVDAATGGTFIPNSYRGTANHPQDEFWYYGDFNTDGMIPIYAICGVAYAMVELIRRVIPRDIVGGNVQKLRKMDAMVHIFYEITGTAGAFCTGLALIPQLGNNRSFLITPICFTLSAISWFCISDVKLRRLPDTPLKDQPLLVKAILTGFYLFGESIWVGAKIIFSSRKFIWLLPSYGVALYGHRYLENGIAAQVAKRYLGESAWSQIIVGGSNLGELLGALFVFLFTNWIHTPIPWLRLDALMLLVVWYFPYWYPPSGDVSYAWIAAATLVPVSFGWAAGDVSLAAYIQAALAREESRSKNVSALGAVMAFLYSFYVVTYAIAGTFLGRYLDSVYEKTGGSDGGSIRSGLVYTAGVQYTIMSVLIMASTFIPRGAFCFNPKMLFEQNLDQDLPADEPIGDPAGGVIQKSRQKDTERN